jgi:hypothetical protein
MYVGTSIFLIALGAILKYAVTFTFAGIDIQTVGVILMVAGVVCLIVSLITQFAYARRGPRDVEVVREREPVVRERY